MAIKNKTIKVPKWWYILPSYLTFWTVAFSLYNIIDGNGMMETFKIDTGGASEFIMLNSAGRYMALGVAMILGVWVFRTYHAILTVLIARLTMDLVDLAAGLQTGIIEDLSGILQSFFMFILPNLLTLFLLVRFQKRHLVKN